MKRVNIIYISFEPRKEATYQYQKLTVIVKNIDISDSCHLCQNIYFFLIQLTTTTGSQWHESQLSSLTKGYRILSN